MKVINKKATYQKTRQKQKEDPQTVKILEISNIKIKFSKTTKTRH